MWKYCSERTEQNRTEQNVSSSSLYTCSVKFLFRNKHNNVYRIKSEVKNQTLSLLQDEQNKFWTSPDSEPPQRHWGRTHRMESVRLSDLWFTGCSWPAVCHITNHSSYQISPSETEREASRAEQTVLRGQRANGPQTSLQQRTQF